MDRRAKAGAGLTRPELAVLLAYGKLDLFEDIIGSNAPDDPFFAEVLEGYFPRELGRFGAEMGRHRLRREIIATEVDNELVNLCGPTFPRRLRAAAGCDTADLIKAFEAARQVLRFSDAWRRVERLDGKVSAAGQMALFGELAYVLRGQTYWLARRAAREGDDIRALVGAYRGPVDTLKRLVPGVAFALRAESRGAPGGAVDQGRRAQGHRPFGGPDATADPGGHPLGPGRRPRLAGGRRRLRVSPGRR